MFRCLTAAATALLGLSSFVPAAARAAEPAAAVATDKRAVRSHLLFCNEPERLKMPGACADATLTAGHTYTIFYHFRNGTQSAGPFAVTLASLDGGPLRFAAKRGTGDPRLDPTLVGRQAMARYLSAPVKPLVGWKGYARFAAPLKRGQVASGVMQVRCESDARLRIYFRHNRWTIPRASVVLVDEPRRDYDVDLTPLTKIQRIRIGEREPGMHPTMDGAYGMLYAFRIAAPPGRKVKVAFSPRGGKAGLVGSVNGKTHQTRIVGTAGWASFCTAQTGPDGIIHLTTAPFGGVSYPVELVFRLL